MHQMNSQAQNVLVTGATGFLGSALVSHLLDTADVNVLCLVRATGSGEERLYLKLIEAAQSLGIQIEESIIRNRVRCLFGDIESDSCALSESLIAELKERQIHQFWHVAASLRYEDIWKSQIHNQNVKGTHHAVALSIRLDIPEFYYISTAYVSGKKRGRIEEQSYDDTYPHNNQYELSKRLAEMIVCDNVHRWKRVKIFRPSVVIGSSLTNDSLSDSGLYGMVSAFHKFRKWVTDRMPEYFKEHPIKLFLDDTGSINFAPVDMVIKEAIEISQDNEDNELFHHLTNPFANNLTEATRALEKLFTDIKIETTTRFEDLNPIDVIFKSQLDFYIPYMTSDKLFDRRKPYLGRESCFHLDDNVLYEYCRLYYERLLKSESSTEENVGRKLDQLRRQEFICRHGSKFVYYKAGEGPPILLVNAYGMSIEAWRWVINSLSDRYTVLIWEGRGISSPASEDGHVIPYSIEEHRDDIVEIFHQEKIDGAKLITWCSGIKPAALFAHKYPTLVTGIISIAPDLTPILEDPSLTSEWDQNIIFLCKAIQANPSNAIKYVNTIKLILENNGKQKKVDLKKDELTTVLGMINKRFLSIVLQPFLNEKSISSYAQMLQDYFSRDISMELKTVPIRVDFITGGNDIIADPKQVQHILESRKNGTTISIPTASHFLLMESGEQLVRELNMLLGEQTGSIQ